MTALSGNSAQIEMPDHPFKLGHSLTNDFMECRLRDVHPAFKQVEGYRTADGDYVAQPLGKPEPVPETRDMRAQKEEFQTALKAYSNSVKNDPGSILDARSRYTWEQVLSELERADRVYQKNQKGFLFSLETCGKNFNKYEKTVQLWMKLLPTESWQGSLVCGGFKIIFGAIARVGKVRKDVGEVLEQIPVTVDKVYDLIQVYQDRLVQQSHVTQLFLVLLELLQQCVEWFTTKSYKKFLSSLGKGDEYGDRLRETFARFKQLESRIDDKASLNLHRTVDSTDKKLNAVLMAKNTLLANTYKLLSGVESCENAVNYMKAYLEEEKAIKEKALRREQALIQSRRKFLRRNLPYNKSQPLEDLTRCLTMIPANFPHARVRTEWILASPEIHEWTSSESSALLVLNANEETHGGGESAVSMFSAALAHSIAEDEDPEKNLVMIWFGGQNIYSSPLEVACGLLGQLLEKGTANPGDVGRVEGLDLEELGDVLGVLRTWLRAQLGVTTVYCICDSVSCYEDYGRRKGLIEVYGMLADVVDERGEEEEEEDGERGGFPLKVLMTSPTSCSLLGTEFDGRRPRVLTVPVVV